MDVPEQDGARSSSFRAILATAPEAPGGRVVALARDELPHEPITVRVAYSSLNYKDGLAVTGKGRVVRRFPMVCGIDLSGRVEDSDLPAWRPGDEVIATGFGLGEEHWGGYAELAGVRPEWLVRVPEGRDPLWAMSLGTAGLTAMLCVLALEHEGLTPGSAGEDPVVVTGSAGGVGGVAVALLAQSGYKVAAVSGRPELEAYLRRLGASEVLARAELADAPARALDHERFCAGIDVVGGTTLASVLRQTRYGGCVAACGLAGGVELPTSVQPFILRAVTLAGVDSVRAPIELRERAWKRLAEELPAATTVEMTSVEPLERVPALSEEILAGRTKGRVVIDLASS